MVHFLRDLRTFLFTGPLIALSTIFFGTLSLIASIFDRSGNAQHVCARWWSRSLLAIGFVSVEAEGLEKLDPRGSYVLAANHSSYYDTPVIMGTIPLQFRFFAKKGLFQIPFLGWHLERAGHFPVVREDPRASLKAMAEGAKQIQERHFSVLLFPEGGRSEHSLREFKEGAAYIGIKSGVPVVPVGVVGARKVLAMHSKQVIPGTIRLRVGDPIPTVGLSLKDRGALTDQVTAVVARLIGEPVPAKAETKALDEKPA